jgi:hypothetical protein
MQRYKCAFQLLKASQVAQRASHAQTILYGIDPC